MRKKFIALIAATALAAGPAAAQARSAAPLSLSATARAGASSEDANGIRGGIILPTLAILAILGLLAATGTFPFDDGPSSP
ncbi:MAG TPA: hypothetical protein VLK25_11325 [Allosphingosinicella sp.]|nr:hypothetical protein [Allosphingosinicella sp.]